MKIEIVLIIVLLAVLVCGCGLLMLPRCPPCTGNRNERFTIGCPNEKNPQATWDNAKRPDSTKGGCLGGICTGGTRPGCEACGKRPAKYCVDYHKAESWAEPSYSESFLLCKKCYDKAVEKGEEGWTSPCKRAGKNLGWETSSWQPPPSGDEAEADRQRKRRALAEVVDRGQG